MVRKARIARVPMERYGADELMEYQTVVRFCKPPIDKKSSIFLRHFPVAPINRGSYDIQAYAGHMWPGNGGYK